MHIKITFTRKQHRAFEFLIDRVPGFWRMMQSYNMSTHEYSPAMGNKVEVETDCPHIPFFATLSKLGISR